MNENELIEDGEISSEITETPVEDAKETKIKNLSAILILITGCSSEACLWISDSL